MGFSNGSFEWESLDEKTERRSVSRWRWVLVAGIGVLAAIQLVPIDRSNPAVESEPPAPADVRAILERSCYDCHSNETRWPWYSYLAPLSWLVRYDVTHAREHMNFSTWDHYSPSKKRDHLEEIWEQVEKGEMPLWFYLPLHPQARLSQRDKDLLYAWTGGSDDDDDDEDDHEGHEH